MALPMVEKSLLKLERILPPTAGGRNSGLHHQQHEAEKRGMELGRAPFPGVGPRHGVSRESEALLNVLRPHCMAAVMAMEDLLGSAGNPVSRFRTRLRGDCCWGGYR